MQIAYQHANDTVPTPSSKNPCVPAELDELVLWATARDPDERPARRPRDARPAARGRAATSGRPRPLTRTQATMVLAGAATAAARPPPRPPCSEPAASPRGTARHRRPRHPSTTAASDTSALRATADRRKRRGYWLFALVLLLTGLAAGTGWYFGAGPGALADRARDRDAAPRQTPRRCSRTRASGRRPPSGNDPVVPQGQVVGHRPRGRRAGAHAARRSRCSSRSARRSSPVPDVIGQPEADARDGARRLHGGRAEPPAVLAPMSPPGSVIAVLGADGAPLGAEYPELGAVTLVVSVGAVPRCRRACRSATPRRRSTGVGLAVDRAERRVQRRRADRPRHRGDAGRPIRCDPATRSCSRSRRAPTSSSCRTSSPARPSGRRASSSRRSGSRSSRTARPSSRAPSWRRVQTPGGRRAAQARLRGHRQLRLSAVQRRRCRRGGAAASVDRTRASGAGHPSPDTPASAQRAASSSATRNASSSDCMWFRRGSQSDS